MVTIPLDAGRRRPDHDPDGQRDRSAALPDAAVERMTWFHHLAKPRAASAVTEDGLPDALIAQPGFSALVRVTTGGRERTILFDAGVTPTGVVENMRRLEILPGESRRSCSATVTGTTSPGWRESRRSSGEGTSPCSSTRVLAASAHRDPGLEPAELPRPAAPHSRARASRSSRTTTVVPARRLGARNRRGRSHDAVRDRLHGTRSGRSRQLGARPADPR